MRFDKVVASRGDAELNKKLDKITTLLTLLIQKSHPSILADLEQEPPDRCVPDEVLRAESVPAPPCAPPLPTRFQDFDEADHPCNKWWEEHGQYMMSGGGRREFIWACRGWIAREQLMDGVAVTGDALREGRPKVAAPSVPPGEEQK